MTAVMMLEDDLSTSTTITVQPASWFGDIRLYSGMESILT
jgi:hypothetical protein